MSKKRFISLVLSVIVTLSMLCAFAVCASAAAFENLPEGLQQFEDLFLFFIRLIEKISKFVGFFSFIGL